MGPEADLVRPRFARGCRCFAVVLDGSIAGYGWLSAGPEWIREIQFEIRPRKAEAYIWNCVTLPAHRRRGIFASLVAGISEGVRATGTMRIWIGSVDVPAEKALAPLGFHPAVRFDSLVFARMHFTKASFVESALGREARRVLPIRAGLYGGTVTNRRH